MCNCHTTTVDKRLATSHETGQGLVCVCVCVIQSLIFFTLPVFWCCIQFFFLGRASRVPFFLAFPLSTTHTKMSRNTAPNTATTTMRTLPSYLEASTPKEDEYQRAVTILQNFHRFQTTFDLDVIHENDDDDDDRSDTSATGPATTTGRRHPRMILLRTQATDRLTTLATINHHDDDDDAKANVHHVTQQR